MAKEVEMETQYSEEFEKFICAMYSHEYDEHWYGYGDTEKEAITEAEMEMNHWLSKNG